MYRRYFISLAIIMACVGCLSRVIEARGGRDYEVSTRSLFGVELSKSEERAKTMAQKARSEAAGAYRRIGVVCAVGAIVAFLAAYLTHFREAAGAGVILAACSLLLMWLSIAGISWWVMAVGAAACVVAVLLHYQLIDFDLIKVIRNRKGGSDG